MTAAAVTRSGVIPGMMSSVVEHGGVLYLAGITGEGDDIATQTADILSKVDALLADHGSSKDRLLSATLYITDLSLRPAANEVWTAWLPEDSEPARTSAAASTLMPGEFIEIVFTAATANSGQIRRYGRNPGTYHVRRVPSPSQIAASHTRRWFVSGGGRTRRPATLCWMLDA